MKNRVIKTSAFVVENAEQVSLQKDALAHFLSRHQFTKPKHWLHDAPVDLSTLSPQEKLHFVFLFNILSFSYWGNPKWTMSYKKKSYDGSWGLVVALFRAHEEGIPIFDFSFLQDISSEDLAYILRGNQEIPLFADRLSLLRESTKQIVRALSGDLRKLFTEDKDALSLVREIYTLFPFLRDEDSYKGHTIYFDKKAQLFLSDVHFFVRDAEISIQRVEALSACVGYKIPQILLNLGITRYEDDLLRRIQNKEAITKNQEVEIRATSIWAIYLMYQELGGEVLQTQLSDLLWLFSQDAEETYPYHRLRTTRY